MLYEDILGILFPLWVVIVIGGLIWIARNFHFSKEHKKAILEAERERRAHPDIQSGRFTRLYTMPYMEELTGDYLYQYCHEHLPSYYCKNFANMVQISETQSGLSGEVRELYITHLPGDNISAIELTDPHEVEYSGRYRHPVMRSSIDDKGFSQDIRKVIYHFQQEVISKQH